MDTTLDGLLDRRVTLEQPRKGFRVAVDTVLLAAAVEARTGELILDLGCGVGGAMLCLATRVTGIRVVGVDIQEELIEIALRNIERNDFHGHLEVSVCDATSLPNIFQAAFDHVMINPPFHEEARHDASPLAIKRQANTEQEGDLVRWIASAASALKPNGGLTVIHRADRLQDILAALSGRFGEVGILPLEPKVGVPARRVIVRAKLGDDGLPPVQYRPLILHALAGTYVDEVEQILRHVKQVDFIEAAT